MLRDCFLPENKVEDRPIIEQCRELQEAMIYCTGVLPFVPKEKRYNLAAAIAAMASTYAFMDSMHDDYMKEYKQTHGDVTKE